MNTRIKSLLNAIVNWLNNIQNIKDEDSRLIKFEYEKIKSYGETEDLFLFFRNEYKGSPDILIMILSILFEQVKSVEIIHELYKFSGSDELDFFTANWIRAQMNRFIFLNKGFNLDYHSAREVQSSLANKLRKQLDLNLPRIKMNERDKNKIIILTNQFINEQHAPTAVVKRFCYELKRNFGKDVELVICVENSKVESDKWLASDIYCSNYKKEYIGEFQYNYNHETIKGNQVILREENLDNIKNVLLQIYNKKPYLVWYIGGLSVFPEIVNDFTTLIAHQCTAGYSISSAPIMINSANDKSDYTQNIEKYLINNSQLVAPIHMYQQYDQCKYKYSRDQFLIPSDAFVLLLVGSRLDLEITKEFINVLVDLLNEDSSFYILLIGNCSKEDEFFGDEIFKNKVKNLGFQKNLIETIVLGDLFVNPPRQGGGGGAKMALSVGVPVLTLENCDVATVVGDDFVCSTYVEMKEQVLKYKNDHDFYSEQKMKAINRDNEMIDNLTENIAQILSMVDMITN